MTKKSSIILHSIYAICAAALMVIAAFYDQNISEVAYVGGGVAVAGGIIGKLPAWLLACVAAGILFKSARHKEKKYNSRVPLMVGYIIIAYFAGFMLGMSIVEDVVSGIWKYLIAVIVGILAGTCTIVISLRISLEHVEKLKKWAILSLICIAIIAALTLLLKMAWGRERYVDVVNNQAAFTPWYLPQGFSSEGASFPSGHTALAGCMFLLPMMNLCEPNLKNNTGGTFFLSWIIVLFIALTRLLGGQHYLSDVVISIIIAYTTIHVVFGIGFGKNLENTAIKSGTFLSKL